MWTLFGMAMAFFCGIGLMAVLAASGREELERNNMILEKYVNEMRRKAKYHDTEKKA